MNTCAMDILIWILVIILLIVGLAGTLIPIIPGGLFIFLGILIYALYSDFEILTGEYIALMGVLTLFAFIMDQIGMVAGLKIFKATKRSVWIATIGSVIGLFIWPPLGIIFFCFLGAFSSEYYEKKNIKQALYSSFGAIIGFLSGTAFKVILGIVMVISFLGELFY